MEKSINSELIGMFIFNETLHTYEQNEGKVHWELMLEMSMYKYMK